MPTLPFLNLSVKMNGLALEDTNDLHVHSALKGKKLVAHNLVIWVEQ